MRGGQVQGTGSGRSPAACGGESRLRLLCSGEAGTKLRPSPGLLQGLSGGCPPPPQIREEKEILVKRAKKEYNENSI